MASTEKLPSGKYRGVYRDAAGKKQHTPVRDRKSDAREDAVDAEAKAMRAAALGEGTLSARTTWGAWCEVWWPDRDIAASTEANEATIRDRELIPEWGDTPLNKIGRNAIQKWVNTLITTKTADGRKRKASYVLRLYGLFRTSMLAAVDAGVLLANPCVKIKLPKAGATSTRVFEQHEVDAFLPVFRRRHRLAVELMLETGLRPGELAGAHRDQVSRASGWLTVSNVLVRSGRFIKSMPKDEDARDVPLSSRALEILDELDREIPRRDGCGVPHEDGSACRSDLIYRQLNGAAMSLTSMRDTFARTLDRAGVAHGRLYDLRHYFASRLAEAGLDAYEIARLLGHATVNQSITYIHRTASARRRFLVAIGDPSVQGMRAVGRGTAHGTDPDNQALPDTPTEDIRDTG